MIIHQGLKVSQTGLEMGCHSVDTLNYKGQWFLGFLNS